MDQLRCGNHNNSVAEVSNLLSLSLTGAYERCVAALISSCAHKLLSLMILDYA